MELLVDQRHSRIGAALYSSSFSPSEECVQLYAVCQPCKQQILWDWLLGTWYCPSCRTRFSNRFGMKTSSETVCTSGFEKSVVEWVSGWLDIPKEDVSVSL